MSGRDVFVRCGRSSWERQEMLAALHGVSGVHHPRQGVTFPLFAADELKATLNRVRLSASPDWRPRYARLLDLVTGAIADARRKQGPGGGIDIAAWRAAQSGGVR